MVSKPVRPARSRLVKYIGADTFDWFGDADEVLSSKANECFHSPNDSYSYYFYSGLCFLTLDVLVTDKPFRQ